MQRNYYVYILTNRKKTVLYTGVTGDIQERIWQHKTSVHPKSFTAKYRVYYLVYYEEYDDIDDAIVREKRIKKWKRQWKNELINSVNPNWNDLTGDLSMM